MPFWIVWGSAFGALRVRKTVTKMLNIIFIVLGKTSNIILKLADLRTCTLRRHGSMVFKALALRIFMICSWFSVYSHVAFRFILGSFREAILIRLGICLWSFEGQEVTKMLNMFFLMFLGLIRILCLN